MEDAATAEISRAQLWQWIRHGVQTIDGQTITGEFYLSLKLQEMEKIKILLGEEKANGKALRQASELMDKLVLSDYFIDFLTLPTYPML